MHAGRTNNSQVIFRQDSIDVRRLSWDLNILLQQIFVPLRAFPLRLFDPHSRDNNERDEDHLALMMELLGTMPRKIALGGRHSREFFNRYGDLRHIRRLRFWALNEVLIEKYEFNEQDANEMADFLHFVPEKRLTAAQCLSHPWITGGPKHLAPPLTNSLSEPTENGRSENNSENNEREAMEARVGNITINGGSGAS